MMLQNSPLLPTAMYKFTDFSMKVKFFNMEMKFLDFIYRAVTIKRLKSANFRSFIYLMLLVFRQEKRHNSYLTVEKIILYIVALFLLLR